MKQGNSESDQTPDFVCFRKVVYSKGPPPEFCMFSRKNRIFDNKFGFSIKKIGFLRKKSDLRKKSHFREKKFGISFSPQCHNFFFLKNSIFLWTFLWRNRFK